MHLPQVKPPGKNLRHATNKRISRKGSVEWEVQRADEVFMCAGGGVTQRERSSVFTIRWKKEKVHPGGTKICKS